MSNSNATAATTGGTSIFTVAVVVLFILKVGKVTPYFAKLSWWWVFAPWWIPFLIVLVIALVVLFFVGMYHAGRNHGRKRSGYSTGFRR